jgi:nicotinate phosphoribosyltransferase
VAECLPRYTLLLDTYDVRRAIQTAVEVAKESRQKWGHHLAAVRLDSGDILADSRFCREVLDDAGLREVQILASGDMDEYKIGNLVAAGAPIDAYGVGTALAVGAGSVEHGVSGGALGGVYKLVWYDADESGSADASEAPIKVAGPKSTWPGKKQVSRIGMFREDVIHLEDETPLTEGRSLLQPVARDGAILQGALPTLGEIREYATSSLAALPDKYKTIENPAEYPVRTSTRLNEMRQRAMDAHAG